MYKNLNNWWIVGLFDAEGSFVVNVIRDNTRKTGYNVIISIEMAMNYKDKDLIENIKNIFNIGNIYFNSNDKTYKWKVSNLEDIYKIIPFFNKYNLLTQKRVDFEIFTKIVDIIKSKEHLTQEGLQKIIDLKVLLNLGLSDKLKEAFPNTNYMMRSKINFKEIPDPNWLSGFSEGEGCFYISIYKSPKSKIGLATQLVFKLTQHIRDYSLLKGIEDYLKCGRVEIRKNKEGCDYTVTSIKALKEYIIPFFEKYPLEGSKLLNYEDFKKAFEIVKAKDHLTEEGMKKLQEIKVSMNTGRK
uniref:hypothetical protein n=1 Tax=Coccidioides posadasii TaxID=199306 RepID=UPI001D014173|nr:hypothetical protein LI437_mgp05 [Coccidioides posadasii]QVG61987.1 hypothetical protein [Coccidioides posadasii]